MLCDGYLFLISSPSFSLCSLIVCSCFVCRLHLLRASVNLARVITPGDHAKGLLGRRCCFHGGGASGSWNVAGSADRARPQACCPSVGTMEKYRLRSGPWHCVRALPDGAQSWFSVPRFRVFPPLPAPSVRSAERSRQCTICGDIGCTRRSEGQHTNPKGGRLRCPQSECHSRRRSESRRTTPGLGVCCPLSSSHLLPCMACRTSHPRSCSLAGFDWHGRGFCARCALISRPPRGGA